jgi:hypothetical protein
LSYQKKNGIKWNSNKGTNVSQLVVYKPKNNKRFGEQWVNCLAQWQNDRFFFTLSARGFNPATFQLLAQRSNH